MVDGTVYWRRFDGGNVFCFILAMLSLKWLVRCSKGVIMDRHMGKVV